MDTVLATRIVKDRSASKLTDAILGLKHLLEEDYRDVISGLMLYFDAAGRIGQDPDAFFIAVSKKAGWKYGRFIREFVRRDPADKRLEASPYRWKCEPESRYVDSF